MNKKRRIFGLTGWVLGLGALVVSAPTTSPPDFPVLTGPYLGQKTPGARAELFAPGIVSTGMNERDMAITPGGDEIFYGLSSGARLVTIMTSRLKDGRWTEPEVASFARDLKYFHFEPALSSDGKTVFFLTNRPRSGEAEKPGWTHQNIWAADRKPDGSWGEPYDLGDPINTADAEFFPSLTRDGTLYFTRAKTPPGNQPALMRARRAGQNFQAPELLPAAVNGQGSPYNAFVDPDERYLIACVDGRKDAITPGRPNYYVFFRDAGDGWSEGANLGEEVNFRGASASSPYITPDRKYLFFGSSLAKDVGPAGATEPLTFGRLFAYFIGPQNGGTDIYWIEASFLEKLRPAYSYLMLFAGSAEAALTAWKIKVKTATARMVKPAPAKTNHPISTR